MRNIYIHMRSQSSRNSSYDDTVDAGAPRPSKYGGDVGGMALPAIVDPLEHVICRAPNKV